MRLAREGAGQRRLARSGRPVEQYATRDPRAELRVALRVPQEVHDFDELVLGLVDPGDVLEGDSLLLAGSDSAGRRPAEAAKHAAASAPSWRRASQMKNATMRSVGRKPSRGVTHSDLPASGGSALTTMFCLLRRLVS